MYKPKKKTTLKYMFSNFQNNEKPAKPEKGRKFPLDNLS